MLHYIRAVVTLLLLAALFPLARAQVSFFQPPSARGNFVGDFNGDGVPDLFSNGETGLENGQGTFTIVTPSGGSTTSTTTTSTRTPAGTYKMTLTRKLR